MKSCDGILCFDCIYVVFLPAPCISESCIKINLKFFFHTSLCFFKRFCYVLQGLHFLKNFLRYHDLLLGSGLEEFFYFLFFARLFTLTRKKVLVPTFGSGLLSVISKVNIHNLSLSKSKSNNGNSNWTILKAENREFCNADKCKTNCLLTLPAPCT